MRSDSPRQAPPGDPELCVVPERARRPRQRLKQRQNGMIACGPRPRSGMRDSKERRSSNHGSNMSGDGELSEDESRAPTCYDESATRRPRSKIFKRSLRRCAKIRYWDLKLRLFARTYVRRHTQTHANAETHAVINTHSHTHTRESSVY